MKQQTCIDDTHTHTVSAHRDNTSALYRRLSSEQRKLADMCHASYIENAFSYFRGARLQLPSVPTHSRCSPLGSHLGHQRQLPAVL